MYKYNAIVVKVIDADTIEVRVDLGFKVSTVQRLSLARVARVDVLEARGKGRKAKEFVLNAIPVGTMVMVQTSKTREHDQYIAEVNYMLNLNAPWMNDTLANLSDQLLENGHATLYNEVKTK